MGREQERATTDESAEALDALERAIDARDTAGGLAAAAKLMAIAEAEADLSAAHTAICSNLAKLDEIGRLETERNELREALERIAALSMPYRDFTNAARHIARSALSPESNPEGQ